jgi:hypothetical protein
LVFNEEELGAIAIFQALRPPETYKNASRKELLKPFGTR